MFAIWGDEGLTEEDVEAIRAIWEPVGRRRGRWRAISHHQ
jgi:hypothetical protein